MALPQVLEQSTQALLSWALGEEAGACRSILQGAVLKRMAGRKPLLARFFLSWLFSALLFTCFNFSFCVSDTVLAPGFVSVEVLITGSICQAPPHPLHRHHLLGGSTTCFFAVYPFHGQRNRGTEKPYSKGHLPVSGRTGIQIWLI